MAALLQLPPATQVGGPTGSVAHDDSAPSAHAAMTEGTAGSGKRVAGPQNWYASHGPPAEQLPKADVGPHLPPGDDWPDVSALLRLL